MISITSPWLGHVTLDIKKVIKKIQILPLIFNEALKFLSILHQTHSNSLSFWNLNSVYTLDKFQSSPIGWPQFSASMGALH
jgi:hypothetical protein